MVKQPRVAADIMVSQAELPEVADGSCFIKHIPLNTESWRCLAKVTIIDQEG